MNETRAHTGASFSHLATLVPATVTISRGAVRAVFSTRELEARLDIAGIGAQLAGLLHGTQRDSGGLGESKDSPLSVNANADKHLSQALALEGSGEPADTAVVDDFATQNGFAEYLARALGDTALKDIRHYKRIVRVVPRAAILDALGRVKDTREYRRSPGALFTHILQPFLKKPNP